MTTYRGGCSCGAVRFTVGRFLYVMACHCDACKKRTGSAYGLSVMVDDGDVTQFTGKTNTFVRIAESGRPVHYEFCPDCGTTVRWRVEVIPNRQIFAAGAFDDFRSLPITGEMYTDMANPWARLDCDLVRPGAPDEDFRAALIVRSKSLQRS